MRWRSEDIQTANRLVDTLEKTIEIFKDGGATLKHINELYVVIENLYDWQNDVGFGVDAVRRMEQKLSDALNRIEYSSGRDLSMLEVEDEMDMLRDVIDDMNNWHKEMKRKYR